MTNRSLLKGRLKDTSGRQKVNLERMRYKKERSTKKLVNMGINMED